MLLGPETIPLNDGRIIYFPQFLTFEEEHNYFNSLMAETKWRHDEITMFGKRVKIPRLQAWYGDKGLDYTYSGLTMEPESWTSVLLQLKQRVEEAAAQPFNTVLLNLYRDGQDKVGWHSDDEPELGKHPQIASLSLGETRKFAMKHKATGEKFDLVLPGGSLLIMAGETQQFWQHTIPAQKRVIAPRINLTFRTVKPFN